MKVSCDIIRDLLPLYAEDMVSQASKELVDEHLCGCDECVKELGKLKKAAQMPVEVDTGALKKVENTIRKKRILAVITVLLAAVTLYASVALLLDARIYLTAEQAIESVEAREDGSIRVRLTNAVIGIGTVGSDRMDINDLTGNFGIIASSNLRKLLFSKPRLTYEEMPEEFKATITEEYYNARFDSSIFQLGGLASTQNFWYCSAKDGRGQTLLWDAGNPYPQAPLGEVNYHLAYYCIILICLCAMLAYPAHRFHDRWYGKLYDVISTTLGCICLSVIIVSAGQFMELWGEFTECFVESFILAIPMTLTVLFARWLHKLNKQDKGI